MKHHLDFPDELDSPITFSTCELDCAIGYRVEMGQCVKNNCNCQGGNKLENCPINNSEMCKTNSCYHGFHQKLIEKEISGQYFRYALCQKNVCKCENGLSPNVCAHNENFCINCNKGYHKKAEYRLDVERNELIFETFCRPNICQCLNGIAVSVGSKSWPCESHLSQQCSSCKPGFHLQDDRKQCIKNVCLCENGFADGTRAVLHMLCSEHWEKQSRAKFCFLFKFCFFHRVFRSFYGEN